ncbi:MAG: hypothetical protein GX456_07435 [Verrucomicrobia bacterium]|nr:hypothetical protein [Verrucomicrobiota bacterium]
MQKILALMLLSATLLILWCLWNLQPWRRQGDEVHVGSWRFGDCEFQIWQRKTWTVTEPFATGLFFRKGAGPWRAFLLDFEDLYRPNYVLRNQSNGVAVFKNGKRRWFLDLGTEQMRRESDGQAFVGGAIQNAPPGNWWAHN